MQEPCRGISNMVPRGDATGTFKKLLREAGQLISPLKSLISQSGALADMTGFCRDQEHDGKHQ